MYSPGQSQRLKKKINNQSQKKEPVFPKYVIEIGKNVRTSKNEFKKKKRMEIPSRSKHRYLIWGISQKHSYYTFFLTLAITVSECLKKITLGTQRNTEETNYKVNHDLQISCMCPV